MAIEIIKNTKECDRCFSKMEFDPEDVKTEYDYDNCGHSIVIKYIICPYCNNKIILKKF